MEVRLEFLRPSQIEAAIAKCPLLYMPLGTIEWHGRQNVVGLDAVKAHALCVRAAQRAGGLVAPPVYGGMGGMAEPFTFVIEDGLISSMLRLWLERLCSEAIRIGFKAVIMLTGHYGSEQQIVVREAAVRMTRLFNRPVLGTPECFLALDENYIGDHAAFFETSLMMDLYPDSVDLNELGEAPHQGVLGEDPKRATPADGKRLNDAIVGRLGALAGQMPDWDNATIEAFADAEDALVKRQLFQAARENQAWDVMTGAFAAYPALLVSRQFDEIKKLVKKL